MCGRGDFSAQNAHGCPNGSDDEERYVESFFSQTLRYGFHVFKTNRNGKQESTGISFHQDLYKYKFQHLRKWVVLYRKCEKKRNVIYRRKRFTGLK